MYPEDDLLPISALQHLLFCERQAALIHVERQWAENRLTAEGRVLHEKTHSDTADTRKGVRTVRSLQLRSLRLGLCGRADVVEFRPDGTVTPVEYKRGKPKQDGSDRVQLCAQALCLEEMLGVAVPRGELFYGQRRRRTEVVFDEALRTQTEQAAARMRHLLDTGTTPPAVREPKCDGCSLFHLCLPEATTGRKRVGVFLGNQLDRNLQSAGPTTD